ncbi:MAG: insulinase family protein, partial [Alphaproteobacteria bacterium]|nr:insulinase family protein [Alphaproteobacteria bacterium]
PDKIETFYTQVARVVEELRNTKVSAEELERARGPRVQDIQKQQQTNEYWLSLLSGSAQDPRLLDVIRTTIPDLQSVTIDDVQKAARDYLVNERAYTLVIAPKELMPAAAAP